MKIDYCQSLICVVGACYGLAISVTFAVLYKLQLDNLENDELRFVMEFGFGVYLAWSVSMVLTAISGFHKNLFIANAVV